ncbi:MAG TPA: GNAT family N-acetyltransferase [Acidimicrobiales bacterium]|nr:GNAT family N-acetyltransferase [Acidimicrobiales bacterium]
MGAEGPTGGPTETVIASGYPAELEVDACDRWGDPVHLRPIRPADAERLVAFHEHLSPSTVYLRFFTLHPHLSEREVQRFTTVDYQDRLAIVAEVDGLLVGVGRYDRMPGTDEAEVAFVVADAFQRRGIGVLLLRQLVAAARPRGIHRFLAETLEGNAPMLSVFKGSGFPLETHVESGGVISLGFPIGEPGAPC